MEDTVDTKALLAEGECWGNLKCSKGTVGYFRLSSACSLWISSSSSIIPMRELRVSSLLIWENLASWVTMRVLSVVLSWVGP